MALGLSRGREYGLAKGLSARGTGKRARSSSCRLAVAGRDAPSSLRL